MQDQIATALVSEIKALREVLTSIDQKFGIVMAFASRGSEPANTTAPEQQTSETPAPQVVEQAVPADPKPSKAEAKAKGKPETVAA